jgi:hypothetical protein
VVAKHRTKQAWELAAAKLVDDIRWLLGYREAIVAALGESAGRDEAESRLREIHALVTALEVEVARAATADDREAVGNITRLLKKTAAAVGITITTTAAALVTTDVHNALTAVDKQADQVIECVIKADDLTIEPGTLRLRPGDVTVTTGGDQVGQEVDLGYATSDAVADAFGDLTVTQEGDTSTAEGTAEGAVAFAATAEGRAVAFGTAVEREEALPITPRRGGDAGPGGGEAAPGTDGTSATATRV